jgi:hypothetical protein
VRQLPGPHIAIVHEGDQRAVVEAGNAFFDYFVAPDPSILLRNPIVFKTGRIVPPYVNRFPLPTIPTIGSFGFGTEGKGFEELIMAVQNEFDRAILRLHIPHNDIVDSDGTKAVDIARRCRALITKPGIDLRLSHDFLSTEALLDFLAENTVNAFYYARFDGRGISSVTDYALAVRRPIAISRSRMFRHLHDVRPSLCHEDTPLREIMNRGVDPLLPLINEWTEENFVWDYERILTKIIGELFPNSTPPTLFSRVRRLMGLARKSVLTTGDKRMSAPDSVAVAAPPVSPVVTHPDIVAEPHPNRILDNEARRQYAPVIQAMFALVPEMMARKIPAANIQQAFVFNSVRSFQQDVPRPRILSIGSYEDTAAAALECIGVPLEAIDPVLNYDLNTFVHKPSTRGGGYDIIFATSVLEHVRDDKLFIQQMQYLLSPGGVGILTCDFQEGYRSGDPLPREDFRLYTRDDFTSRLLPAIPDCALVGAPQWACPAPDFFYAGCAYTFASLVFRKTAV